MALKYNPSISQTARSICLSFGQTRNCNVTSCESHAPCSKSHLRAKTSKFCRVILPLRWRNEDNEEVFCVLFSIVIEVIVRASSRFSNANILKVKGLTALVGSIRGQSGVTYYISTNIGFHYRLESW